MSSTVHESNGRGRPAAPRPRSSSRDDWRDYEWQILQALDLHAEAVKLGLRLVGRTPNVDGWIACHAMDREDKSPSASFNVSGDRRIRGRYVDHGGQGLKLSFFDLAARLRPFADWRAAQEHYAKQVGVEPPGKGSGSKRPLPLAEQVQLQPDNESLRRLWAHAKQGVDAQTVLDAGGQYCRWNGMGCLVFWAYLPGDSQPTAGILYQITGKPFPATRGLAERKSHLLRGSHDGLVIVGGPERLAAASVAWKCEGVPDALALAHHLPPDHVAVTNVCGAGSFRKELAQAFVGKTVHVVHDADVPGQVGAEKWCQGLAAKAIATKNVALPYEVAECHGRDLRDWLNEGHTLVELMELAGNAPVQKAKAKHSEIVIDTDEKRVADEAIEALVRQGIVFQRGGLLVQVVRELERPTAIQRPPHSPQIVVVPEPRVREILADGATWVKEGPPSETGEPKTTICHVPGWVTKAVAARGEYAGIRPIEGVVEAPVLRPDGTVLQKAGYDRATGLLYEPQGEFPAVPEHPTREKSDAAARELLQVVVDFPFTSQLHRAAWMAGVLTPLSRHAFAGPAPMFLMDANTAGSGKSMLCDLVAIIATGRIMARTAQPEKDEEFRKRVTAIALAGDPLVLIDNVTQPLGGASLDAVLTGTTWKDRMLGESRMTRELPLNTTWFASGNNVVLLSDTTRRCVHVRLDSPVEKPEERTDFQEPNLLAWASANRPRLVTAVLTILRAYVAAGCPNQEIKPWGSFEGWSALVRQSLVWIGQPDPGETRQELRAKGDVEAVALRALLHGLEALAPEGLTAGAILQLLERKPDEHDGLRNAVLDLCPSRAGKFPSARSLGNRFRRLRGRIAQGRSLDSQDTNAGAIWLVRRVGPHDEPSSSGASTGSTGSAVLHLYARESAKVDSDQERNIRWGETEALEPPEPPPPIPGPVGCMRTIDAVNPVTEPADPKDGIDSLLSWGRGLAPDDLPPTPFELRPGVTITNGHRWLSTLRAALSDRANPVQREDFKRDLECLRELVGCSASTTN